MTVTSALRRALLPFGVAKVLTVVALAASVLHASGSLSWQGLRGSLLHWDAISYLDIARDGYPVHLDYHDAFLPGYPLLIRAFSVVVRDPVAAAFLISAVAELVAITAVIMLVSRERDAGAAIFAAWCVALAPLGFFLSGVYTESVFIAAAAAALCAMRRGRFAWAATASAAAMAVRLTGVVLIPVLVLELLRQRADRTAWLWLLLAPLPVLLYGAYMQLHIGDGLALLHAESLPSFGESTAWPWDGLRVTWQTAAAAADPQTRSIFQREILFGLLGAVAVAVGWMDARFPRSLAVYCTLVWLLAVSLTFWRSVPRYDLALFPVVVVLADVTARLKSVRPALVTASAGVMAWGAWTFATGAWIG